MTTHRQHPTTERPLDAPLLAFDLHDLLTQIKEEAYALPPLGLLPQLAAGTITPEMRQVLAMTERLQAELPHMLQEHQAIVSALKTLSNVAEQEQQTGIRPFCRKIDATRPDRRRRIISHGDLDRRVSEVETGHVRSLRSILDIPVFYGEATRDCTAKKGHAAREQTSGFASRATVAAERVVGFAMNPTRVTHRYRLSR